MYLKFHLIMYECSKLILISLLFSGILAFDRPVVETQNGLIRGVYKTSKYGRQFMAFEGIPYAKPPVGDLRFKEAEPIEPWTGIWDATTAFQCLQLNHVPTDSSIAEGTEDCLYVNVYSPRLNNEIATMDVMIHIHGGAFMFGQGSLWGPDLIMDRDVVYVSLNYRLGALGFLSTEDDVVPGNNGLKDQTLALKWIKENIEQFGGNPESITLTGLSAGGASVHYHFLSPLSKDLFHRGISISGTALCNWALVENPLQKARKLASLVGCEQKSTADLVECLRQRPAKQIVQMVKKFQPWLYNPYSPFGPVVEPASTTAAGRSFLPDLPYNLLVKGQVADLPWITSVTSEEGLYPAAGFVYNEERLPYLEKNWSKLAPYILHFDSTASKDYFKEIAEQIRDFYLDGKKISRDTFAELVQAVGDRLFVVDAEKTARLQANANESPVYFYKFSHRGDHSLSEYHSQSTENFGVSHADDVLYVVSADPTWFAKYIQTQDDKKMSNMLIDMWITFAKTEKPKMADIKWPKVSRNLGDKLKFLHIISPDNLQIESADELGYRSFWDSLPIKENNNIFSSKNEEL